MSDIHFLIRQRPIKSKQGKNMGSSYCEITKDEFRI